MEQIRKPLQGVKNIVYFNWHLYVAALIGATCLLLFGFFFPNWKTLVYCLVAVLFLFLLISLVVSYYIYDCSSLYKLTWLDDIKLNSKGYFLNIHAGFDETSLLLKAKFPKASIEMLDFYDANKHTESAIKRARKLNSPLPATHTISTHSIPIVKESADGIFLILSAHEIRDKLERELFFRELARILIRNGKIILIEHLRDLPNLLAYNIGYLHFFSEKAWRSNWEAASLTCVTQASITPFIKMFILEKHDDTY